MTISINNSWHCALTCSVRHLIWFVRNHIFTTVAGYSKTKLSVFTTETPWNIKLTCVLYISVLHCFYNLQKKVLFLFAFAFLCVWYISKIFLDKFLKKHKWDLNQVDWFFLPLKTAVNEKFGGGGQMTNDANFPGFLSFLHRLW